MVMTMGRRRRRPRYRGGGVRGRQINWARLQLLTVTTTAELRSTNLLQHRLANVVAIVPVALAVVMVVLALQLLHLLGERFESGVGVGLGLLRVVLLHLFFGLLRLLLLLIIMSQ